MKRSAVIIVVVLIVVAVGIYLNRTPADTSPPANTASAEVVNTDQITIANLAFSPAAISVTAGSTVTWINNDNTPHTVVVDGEISPTLQNGDRFTHTFNTAGTFSYSCGIHPAMTGAVTVK